MKNLILCIGILGSPTLLGTDKFDDSIIPNAAYYKCDGLYREGKNYGRGGGKLGTACNFYTFDGNRILHALYPPVTEEQIRRKLDKKAPRIQPASYVIYRYEWRTSEIEYEIRSNIEFRDIHGNLLEHYDYDNCEKWERRFKDSSEFELDLSKVRYAGTYGPHNEF